MAKPDTSFKVRMPDDLKVRISDAAESAGRSMNAEIVHRLEATFEPATKTDHGEVAQIAGRAAQEGALSFMRALIPLLGNQSLPAPELAATLRRLTTQYDDATELYRIYREDQLDDYERHIRKRGAERGLSPEQVDGQAKRLRNTLERPRRAFLAPEVQQKLKELDDAIDAVSKADPSIKASVSQRQTLDDFLADLLPNRTRNSREAPAPPRRRSAKKP